ncbi:sensor histidine kinase [Chryseobacterium capnotolerans]|uniref:sensor histidine kinase n=1 Tax=Chryseobacterium TaxID=59732 RepID=UPI00083A8708|nr:MULTISPECIES: sensor histidine kinase [Chryseobacterium]UHO37951.1 sensor histidine kinase [Chryseobacterium capnotolerans]
MQTSVKGITPFLERISQLDFEKFYTPANRILCHTLMWIFFSALFFLNFWVELKMLSTSSLLMTLRGTINNMTVFYLFFYVVIPRIFKSKTWSILLILLCIPLSIYVWLSVNFFQYNILNYFGIDIHEGPLKGLISKNANQSYLQALSLKNVFGNAMLVIYSFSPPFFVKILFDITRLFNRTIYFQKQTSELELQNLNIEKDFLKAQLNPHFLFNTLNNLYGLVVKKDPSAPEAIINISDLMAYTLYESNTEKVPIEKELDFIRNYFYLERMRYSADKDITLDISLPEDIGNTMIAPLLSFTFIENAFKYGLKSGNDNFLKINIHIVNNIFYFAIENDKDKNSKKTTTLGGIGVKNIEKRLKLLYPNNHEILIEDRETSFFVSLSINLT